MTKKKNTHFIQLSVFLDEQLGINSVIIDENTTHLPSDSELIRRVAFTLLKSIHLNRQDVELQDLLGSLNIKLEQPEKPEKP